MSQHTQHADLSGLGASDEPPYTWRTLLLSLFMVAFVVLLLSFAQESDERAAAEPMLEPVMCQFGSARGGVWG